MAAHFQIPEHLRRGRRGLESLAGVVLLRDWQPAPSGRWFLEIALAIGSENGDAIPLETRWHVVASSSYPEGTLEIYPSRAGGITTTFHHQSHNSLGDQNCSWRRGNLCLTTPTAGVVRRISQTEPFDTDTRLRWRVERALEWLGLAAARKLAEPGDPYEVPPVPIMGNETVVFNEGPTTFPNWSNSQARFGSFCLKRVPNVDSIRVVTSFSDTAGALILEPSWGRLIQQEAREEVGIWIRLPNEPVLTEWHVPDSWGELDELLAQNGLSMSQVFRDNYGHIRNGSAPVLALGFPIPEIFSGSCVQLHWCFIQMPTIRARREKKKYQRYPDAVFWQRDKTVALTGSIQWIASENWSPETLGSRGRLPEEITGRRVLLIGAGALGASVGELLVRGGSHTVTIVDGDRMSAGNLVRHTLDMRDLGFGKATRLARHLNAVSPHANVEGIDTSFPPIEDEIKSLTKGHSLVIDCTAEDGVVKALDSMTWSANTVFCSFSLSFGAANLYAYFQRHRFDCNQFLSSISRLVAEDMAQHPPEAFSREGVGCWHPIFPARVERVVQAACNAIKFLSEHSELNTDVGSFEVL